ncbi:MAG: ABC transporter substrate-binding protein [Alphaproteobacteria bacterium]|nr:ABC transporter substrate-binding protein [Alphaproteobacteria bacterium]MBV8409544.1 ABC transporter substrate-binding protein [Alphaproteobacteria bacterium]
MQRRGLILGAAATSVAAQAPAHPRIVYLSGRSSDSDSHLLAAFRDGLKETGFVDGKNVALEPRWADGRYNDVPAMMAKVVATEPDLIAAVGGNPVGLAAKRATSTIPVVFIAGADPVAIGLVDNMNRPQGNLTGVSLWAQDLDAKRLELLHDMVPGAQRVALLVNPTNPGAGQELPVTEAGASALGLRLDIHKAATSSEIEAAFRAIAGDVGALAVTADAFLINRRGRIIALAKDRKLPAIYPSREFAADGGLASYGASWSDMYRIAGTYAGRLLKGAKPVELPVQRPNIYEMVLNLAAARALGLDLPPLILNRANEVLE